MADSESLETNSPFETRHYAISGEVSDEDWSLALGLLGKLGINSIAFNPSKDPVVPTAEILAPGTIPYALEDINSREQYLGNEHLGSFWPEYRKKVMESGKHIGKHDALCWGINMLTHPRQKGIAHRETPSQQAKFSQSLGLKIVRPRSLVGFSDEYSPNAYGLWSHEEYGDAVIEVGSFIDGVRRIAELPRLERPYGVDGPVINFLYALADKLEAQIEAVK